MQKKMKSVGAKMAKGLVAASVVSLFLFTTSITGYAQSGNTSGSTGTAKEQLPSTKGASTDKGTYTQQDSVRGKTYGNTGTIGSMQDTTRNGQRTGTRSSQTGVYGNTGGRLDSSRTDGQQMSNTGNRNDSLMGPTRGSTSTGMGTKSSGNQSGTDVKSSKIKSNKGTRNGNRNGSGNQDKN